MKHFHVLVSHKYLYVKAIIFIWFTWHQIYAMITTLFHSIKIIATFKLSYKNNLANVKKSPPKERSNLDHNFVNFQIVFLISKNIWWWSSFGKYICIFKTCGFLQLWGYFASSFMLYLKLIWFWFYLIYYFFNIFSPLWQFTAIEILKWVIISFLLVSLLKCYTFIITVYLSKCVDSNNWHLWRNKFTHTNTYTANHFLENTLF